MMRADAFAAQKEELKRQRALLAAKKEAKASHVAEKKAVVTQWVEEKRVEKEDAASRAPIKPLVEKSGDVITWGVGSKGQLGHGDRSPRAHSRAAVVQQLAGQCVCEVSAGAQHCAAVTETGLLYTWGLDAHNQLGQGVELVDEAMIAPPAVPRLVLGIEGHVLQASCGARHTAVVTADGCVYTWGYGGNGRLGHGT